MKLVTREMETTALRSFVQSIDLIASEVVITEVPRGLRRVPDIGDWADHWRALRDRVRLVAVDRVLLGAAADLSPSQLRSLDAIHLAGALAVANAIDGVLVYDRRLAEACEAHGLTAMSPGR